MKTKKLLKILDYLPRWAWYLISLSIGGPIGVLAVYLVFHVLGKMAQDEAAQERENAYRRYTASADVYQDEECTVTSDEEINRQWQRTEQSAARAAAQEAKTAPIDENADVGEVIRAGRDAMRRIREANDIIADEALSAQIDSIESSCGQILSLLEQRP
ncbi:MAG: hypothetical protein IJE71_08315, partial [Clostridia bacterium]|nr:hypothetical protein [Clostridia bacterium]